MPRGGARGVCIVPDCGKPHSGRGYCETHYKRWQKRGTVALPAVPSPEDRFWAKVDRNGPISEYRSDLGPCWIWTASVYQVSGYGQFSPIRGAKVVAHRFAYELLVGSVPEGLELDHLCRVRACVNPAHLEPVTHRENVRRGVSPMAEQHRQTTCIHGHPFDDENTYIRPGTQDRQCRTCRQLADRTRQPRPKRSEHGAEDFG